MNEILKSKNLIERAGILRHLIELAVVGLDDEAAAEGAELFPRMRYDGGLIKSGVRINWNGAVMRAASDLWDREEFNPDNTPALWESIISHKGERVIPEVISVGLAFSQGELGWWRERLYRSLLDNNVWTPEEYPAGWEAVT